MQKDSLLEAFQAFEVENQSNIFGGRWTYVASGNRFTAGNGCSYQNYTVTDDNGNSWTKTSLVDSGNVSAA